MKELIKFSKKREEIISNTADKLKELNQDHLITWEEKISHK